MSERSCIVTRMKSGPDAMIRFVAGPDGAVTPDLKGNLPGRGCWVTARRSTVDQAAARNLFRKALRDEVRAAPDLGEQVDRLLVRAALGALGLARKAGSIVLGAVKVDTAVRAGDALAVLHASDASADGVRKIDQARKAVIHAGGPRIAAFSLFSRTEMSLALGSANVIHAALLDRGAGKAALKRIQALDGYRNNDGYGRPGSENGETPQKDVE